MNSIKGFESKET